MIGTRMRPIVGLLLAALIGVSSISLAVARGQTRVGGQIVLCGGATLVTTLDPLGRPLGPPHICPDMALAVMAALSVATVAPQVPVTLAWRIPVAATPQPIDGPQPVPGARDPPRLI
jgi:hypothetical protein